MTPRMKAEAKLGRDMKRAARLSRTEGGAGAGISYNPEFIIKKFTGRPFTIRDVANMCDLPYYTARNAVADLYKRDFLMKMESIYGFNIWEVT